MATNYCNVQALAPVISPLHAQRLEKREHHQLISRLRSRLQDFIGVLATVPFRENTHTLSMDLISLFQRFCGCDLPDGFIIDFGRQISAACHSGKLPFERSTFGRASLAGFKGIDSDLVVIAMRKAAKPAA